VYEPGISELVSIPTSNIVAVPLLKDIKLAALVENWLAIRILDAVILDAAIYLALVLMLEIDAALSRFVKPVLKFAVVVETFDVKTVPHG
jgi:hypothetical protein